MHREQWYPIPTIEGYYITRSGKVKGPRGKELTASRNYQVSISRMNKGISIAYLLLMTFERLPVKGECALHWNDDRSNNSLKNIYWGTKSQNRKDAIRNGKLFPMSIEGRRKLSQLRTKTNRENWKKGVFDNMGYVKRMRKEFLG